MRPAARRLESASSWGAALLVLLAAAVVYSRTGFHRGLSRDGASFVYAGQQAARGIPPYVSAFFHQTPLTLLTVGAGVEAAQAFGFDDVLAARLVFFAIAAACAAALFLLGETLFDSKQAGVLAALTFVGFECFGRQAAGGPREKTLMVLFQILALLYAARRRWFWAGLHSSLAFFTLQTAAPFAPVVALLAFVQSRAGAERMRNAGATIVGGLLPAAALSGYFVYKGAFYDFLDGSVLFVFRGLERTPVSLRDRFLGPMQKVFAGYEHTWLAILVGLTMIGAMYLWRSQAHGNNPWRFLAQDRFAGLLLTFPAPLIISVLDFQGCADFYMALPYAGLGFGWLLYLGLRGLAQATNLRAGALRLCFAAVCCTLAGSAALGYRWTTDSDLYLQREWAQQIEAEYGPDAKIVSIGVPEVLVLLHRTNPNSYPYVISGLHNRIEATTPGGLDGWLAQIEAYDPDVIAFGPTEPRAVREKIRNWLEARYQETTVGEWTLFVK